MMMMNLTYNDLQKIDNQQIDAALFVFDESTQHLTHLSLRDSPKLKEIRFDAPQPNLRYLDASNCSLEKVVFLQVCKRLQVVYLHHNELSHFQVDVALEALELLDLSFNKKLEHIEFKVVLPKFTYFYAHQCNLQDLSSLADYFLRPGFDFNIQKNESLVNPPTAIIAQGKDAVIRHFRKIQEEGKDYLYEAKLLILGDPRAGKTTLARKIINSGAEMPTGDETTHGIDLTPWNFNYSFTERGAQNILINIWDFGGQTIYKQTHRFFLTQRSFYVVLSDGGSSERTDFAYWLHQTKTFGKGSPVVVFINEKEHRSFDVPMDALREINPELKENLAVNLEEVATSGANRFGRIMDSIKGHLASLKHLGEPVPKGWKTIREHFLEKEQEGVKMVSWGNFKEICERNGEKTPEGQRSLAQYFHDIGILLHFAEDDILRKHIFINKQWILNGAYKVVDSKAVEKKLGKLMKADFDALFSGEYDEYRAEIKALLKRFYLIYERDGYYVVPQHLAQGAPKYNWDSQENVRFNFAYKTYMPAGILWQFIVENYSSIKDDLVWRRGVVLDFDGTTAEVIEEYGKDLIRIRVVGPRKEDVRAIIIASLQRINKHFDDLPVTLQVPCVCEACVNEEEPTVFNYNRLYNMKSKDRLEEWCEKLEGEVSIDLLLKGVEHVTEQRGQHGGDTYNSTHVYGDGNVLAQDLKNSEFGVTQGHVPTPNLATKADIDSLHQRHDTHEEQLDNLMALSTAQKELLSKNALQVNNQLLALLEKAENTEQSEALVEINRFLEEIKDNKIKTAVAQVLKDDRIDMTAKLKLVTPFYIRALFGVKGELEFAVKEKVPRTWAEFKALFVKGE